MIKVTCGDLNQRVFNFRSRWLFNVDDTIYQRKLKLKRSESARPLAALAVSLLGSSGEGSAASLFWSTPPFTSLFPENKQWKEIKKFSCFKLICWVYLQILATFHHEIFLLKKIWRQLFKFNNNYKRVLLANLPWEILTVDDDISNDGCSLLLSSKEKVELSLSASESSFYFNN